MTKSDDGTQRAFATFRVVGDKLHPADITQILHTVPTFSFRKGEKYQPGDRSPVMAGKTGTWFFSTDRVVASPRLDDHVTYLLKMILPHSGATDQLTALRDLIHRKNLKAVVTLFWHGRSGSRKPSLPTTALDIFKLLPATVEVDFDADEEPPRKRAAVSSRA
ncbi:MAG TPA: DUF4279 domain-containing protein [Stellaceae bacterium]|nr:DUF4279 domain-containing protein [Stellaceae bacterium]